MSIKFDPAYAEQLISDLQTVLLATELGGQSSKIAQFSYAATGTSAYSFGLLQFDVGASPPARMFLTSIGFTSDQVAQLERHGGLSSGEVHAFNAQLQQPECLEALERFTQQQLQSYISHLEGTLNVIEQHVAERAQLLYQSPELLLRLLDYMNQFGPMSANGPMVHWLCSQPVTQPGGTVHMATNHTLTGHDISNFLMRTRYGEEYPTAMQSRLDRLNGALASIQTSPPMASADAPESIPVSDSDS
jgi:hypothetical protein